MTITDDQPATAAKAPPPLVLLGAVPCGFCNTGNHDICAGRLRNASKGSSTGQWQCPCTCPAAQTPKCMDCLNRLNEGEINPGTWTCYDSHACQARRQAKMDANPAFQHMKEIERKIAMTTAATKPEKAAPAPKRGTCIHTGKATKGGKFAPGQDAAYVSSKVKSVLSKETTEAQVKKEMQGHGLSEALIGKFVKGVALAKEKAAKQAEAAKAAAAAKSAAK